MTNPQNLATQFQALAGDASAGNLIIEHDAAERCAKWCDDYVSALRTLSARAQDLVYVDSFGNLTSASTLGHKFYELANGGAGSGSYIEAVKQHIEILEAMADMYRKAGAAYKSCDAETQQTIAQKTNELA